MIDSIHSLAFSIQSGPGVYAVLLGSGVSRSSQIPTGWEITLDLIRKLAVLSSEDCEPAPEKWYTAKFGCEPDYSKLLDELIKTPAERQQLLRSYLEATEEERNEGVKQPTPAHRSIAAMAAKGYIRVIITTNFDRLMETALIDEGVTPTVFSSPDQVHGALPLIHTQCCVFKVHGDYLDTRIFNTTNELQSYPQEFDQLLDRIFDEFGLIACGWSAEWDEALRSAIERTVSRRFATYWACRGEPSECAQKLISHRGAQTVQIQNADSFFQKLWELVQSIETFSRPHPLSSQAAVASLKRYLPEPKYRIQLDDLISGEVERIIENTKGSKFACQGAPVPNSQTFTDRVRAYEAASEILLAMAPVGGFWAEDEQHYIWERALVHLSSQSNEGGTVLWLELRCYPATLVFYALALGALEGEKYDFLGKLFRTVIQYGHRGDKVAVKLLPPFCLFSHGSDSAKLLNGAARSYAPLNDWLHALLRHPLKAIIPNNERYTLQFDRLEILIALSFAFHDKRENDRFWVPPGSYGYRNGNRERVVSDISESLERKVDSSPYVISKIFGNNAEDCKKVLGSFEEWVPKLNWW